MAALALVAVACIPGVNSAPLKPTEVNITNDPTHRYGEPQLAVNPHNPNNMVYIIMSNNSTYACEVGGSAPDPNCSMTVPGSQGQPIGFWNTPGWYSTKLFVTFDRGITWQHVDFAAGGGAIPAFSGVPGEVAVPDHSDLITRSDPMMTVDANGTFYMGWNAQHLDDVPQVETGSPCCSSIANGIAVSKSTDGGLTWSTPYLTGSGIDRPWMTTDLSTGRVYEASSGFINGSLSNGNAASPLFSSNPDRYVVSSINGVNWTLPQPLGAHPGGNPGPGSFSAAGSTISAANGELVAGFRATSTAACTFFLGVATVGPCTIFQTSTNSGATWARHAVPVVAGSSGSIQVAADPTDPGTSTLVATNSTGTAFQAYVTHDHGVTWTGPNTFTDNPNTVKFKTYINYSPEGLLGLVWRSRTLPAGNGLTPYLVFAATSLDSGAKWSDPLQISKAPSPGSDPAWGTNASDRDDTSYIALNRLDVLVGWGDWRPGDVQGYFSAVNQLAFKNHH